MADFGIVDDYRNIVPAMIKQVKDGYLFPIDRHEVLKE
jgi:hypothetical protein